MTDCNKLCYNLLHMRTIVNISLPSEMSLVVDQMVASGRFASKSEFIRSLLRDWMETGLYGELEESRRELASGKGKLLKSLKDLR